MRSDFFNLSLRQTVNQWLCISLVFVWGFGLVIYYGIKGAEASDDVFTRHVSALQTYLE
jgi:steroid 5-alpha reductase family enzyme